MVQLLMDKGYTDQMKKYDNVWRIPLHYAAENGEFSN